jgi:hypothetical protein
VATRLADLGAAVGEGFSGVLATVATEGTETRVAMAPELAKGLGDVKEVLRSAARAFEAKSATAAGLSGKELMELFNAELRAVVEELEEVAGKRGGAALAGLQELMEEMNTKLVSARTVECANAQQERGKNTQFREK